MKLDGPPLYSIGAVAKMLDIPAATLRAWEDRYSLINPTRSGGSQRLYSRADLEHLRYIKAQIDAGLTAADAHRLLADELRAGNAPASTKTAPDSGPLILIAERDPYAAELAEYFLRTEGWEVVTALEAAQAQLQFQEHAPDVVLVDVLLSGGAGYGLIGEFAATGQAKVIAVSAMSGAEEALRAGAAAFMLKPIDYLQLVSTVRDLAGTSALVRDTRKHRAAR
ncbi:MAG TPA: MerR family transcriptional regulator [Candidatus Dormibacteraeota bacterium]|nr:MerR family transcriptional regulator [Candidatus Dormibacteraeota bacterium]